MQRTMGRSVAKEVFVAGEICVLLKAATGMPATDGDKLTKAAFDFCLCQCVMEMSVTDFYILS